MRYRLKVKVPRIRSLKIISLHELIIVIFGIACPKINDWSKPMARSKVKMTDNTGNQRKKTSAIAILANDVDGIVRPIFHAIP